MTEQLFRLSSVPAVVETITGERPSRATCYRWRSPGIRGVRLRCVWFSGCWRTSESDIRRFIAELSAASETPCDTTRRFSGDSSTPTDRL